MAGLVLSWENPTDLFAPVVRYATIERRDGDLTSRVIETDATWGVYEDLENDDTLAEYTVIYKGPFGEHLFTVGNNQISRYKTPANICKVTFDLIRQDGSPDAGRVIEFTDESTETGQFVRRVVANAAGKAIFFAMPNSALLVRLSGKAKAHHVGIPDVREISYSNLIALHGSEADADPRRCIGLVW